MYCCHVCLDDEPLGSQIIDTGAFSNSALCFFSRASAEWMNDIVDFSIKLFSVSTACSFARTTRPLSRSFVAAVAVFGGDRGRHFDLHDVVRVRCRCGPRLRFTRLMRFIAGNCNRFNRNVNALPLPRRRPLPSRGPPCRRAAAVLKMPPFLCERSYSRILTKV